jgi:hypothetical protein
VRKSSYLLCLAEALETNLGPRKIACQAQATHFLDLQLGGH